MIISKHKHWELKIIEDEVIICYNENPNTHIVRIGKTKSQQRSFHRLASIVSHVPNVTRKPVKQRCLQPDRRWCRVLLHDLWGPVGCTSHGGTGPDKCLLCPNKLAVAKGHMMNHEDLWWYMLIYDDICYYMMMYDYICWYMNLNSMRFSESSTWITGDKHFCFIKRRDVPCPLPCLNMNARTNTHQGFAEPSPVDAQSGTVVIGSALLDGPGSGEAPLQVRREQFTRSFNGNFRILKWRYVSTIFQAIFCGDIPLHRPYIW